MSQVVEPDWRIFKLPLAVVSYHRDLQKTGLRVPLVLAEEVLIGKTLPPILTLHTSLAKALAQNAIPIRQATDRDGQGC